MLLLLCVNGKISSHSYFWHALCHCRCFYYYHYNTCVFLYVSADTLDIIVIWGCGYNDLVVCVRWLCCSYCMKCNFPFEINKLFWLTDAEAVRLQQEKQIRESLALSWSYKPAGNTPSLDLVFSSRWAAPLVPTGLLIWNTVGWTSLELALFWRRAVSGKRRHLHKSMELDGHQV